MGNITKDNAPIDIDFLVFWKVIDPVASVIQVGNFAGASQGIATTTLRAVIGGIPLDDVLSEREHINNMLRTRLDEVTERWGVKVTNVEIREIIPPRDVQDAMNKQMSAERIRRAVVTQSTGTREAAINVADGEKQSNILRAEGEKQSAILKGEGERQAQLLRAEGFSMALDKIFSSAGRNGAAISMKAAMPRVMQQSVEPTATRGRKDRGHELPMDRERRVVGSRQPLGPEEEAEGAVLIGEPAMLPAHTPRGALTSIRAFGYGMARGKLEEAAQRLRCH